MLEITKVDLKKYDSGNMKAFVNLTFNDELTIDSFKLMDGDKGYWIAPPSVKRKEGWSNIVKFSKPLHKDVLELVLKEYEKGSSSSSGSDTGDRNSSSRTESRRRR